MDAVLELDREFGDLKLAARQRLGQLFNTGDYLSSLRGLFDVVWDYPSADPPAFLQQLNPQLYHQECQRISSRFNEAVELAEQAFTDEPAKLVSHLSERLTGAEGGKPKVFRDTAITNLTEFFERFKHLNIRSNEQLDQLVNQAQSIVQGVQSVLDGLLVDRPGRRIIRGGVKEGEVAWS